MLIKATPKICEICGKKYCRAIEQDMMRYCKNCDFSGYICDSCAKKGCPKCGGKLVSVWEKFPYITF